MIYLTASSSNEDIAVLIVNRTSVVIELMRFFLLEAASVENLEDFVFGTACEEKI